MHLVADGTKFSGQTAADHERIIDNKHTAIIIRMPERFAMDNLGHNSKAVHRSYAKKAVVIIPSLETWNAMTQAAPA